MILSIHDVDKLSPLHKPLAKHMFVAFPNCEIHMSLYDYDRSVNFAAVDKAGVWVCVIKFIWNRKVQ